MTPELHVTRPEFASTTGIFVRAIGPDGRWGTHDIAELDAPSLLAWLRSRGGANPWAENTIGILLGHGKIVDGVAA